MSFFVGKDTSGKPLLHLTNAEETLESMKSPTVLATSVFHSSLDYVTMKEYPATSIVLDETITLATFPPEAWADVYDTTGPRKQVLVVIDGAVYLASGFANLVGMFYYWGLANGDFWPDIRPDTVKVAVSKGTATTSASLFVFNIDIDADLIPTANTATDVHIDNTSITVSGNDILDIGYLVPGIVNALDSSFTRSGIPFQVLNTDTSQTGITIENTATYNRISNGSKVVFDSGTPLRPVKVTSTRNHHFPYAGFIGYGASTVDHLIFSGLDMSADWAVIDMVSQDAGWVDGNDLSLLFPIYEGAFTQVGLFGYIGVSVFYIYIHILNGNLYLRCTGQGSNADTLTFLETDFSYLQIV